VHVIADHAGRRADINDAPCMTFDHSRIVIDRRRQAGQLGRRHVAAPLVFRKSLDFGSGVAHFFWNHAQLTTHGVHLADNANEAMKRLTP